VRKPIRGLFQGLWYSKTSKPLVHSSCIDSHPARSASGLVPENAAKEAVQWQGADDAEAGDGTGEVQRRVDYI